MSKVDITVTKRPLKGVPVGGTLSVSPREARILVGLKRATYKTADLSYQTRMMSADPQARSEVQPDFVEEEEEETEARPRRRTRRTQTDE